MRDFDPDQATEMYGSRLSLYALLAIQNGSSKIRIQQKSDYMKEILFCRHI